nr:MAG TPA: hypothetical protein [Caudoviricetes sp.]
MENIVNQYLKIKAALFGWQIWQGILFGYRYTFGGVTIKMTAA